MKKMHLIWLTILLIAGCLAGCDTATDPEATTKPPTEESTEEPTEENTRGTEENIVYEGDASSYYIDVVYAEQIARYDAALTEQWDEGKYLEQGMSALPTAYYQGDPQNNVGFGFTDLDNDGRWELLIGAILDAETDPAVFEIWTLVDDKPVMLVQADAENHYFLQYVEEDCAWYVVNEASNGTTSRGTYYLMLVDGALNIMQGIVYHPEADAKNPWFMTYDQDWDISNDEPIDEETANAILESNRKHNTALEYFPYILYR